MEICITTWKYALQRKFTLRGKVITRIMFDTNGFFLQLRRKNNSYRSHIITRQAFQTFRETLDIPRQKSLS